MTSKSFYVVSVLSGLALGTLVLCIVGVPVLAGHSGVVGGWYAEPEGTCCGLGPQAYESCGNGAPSGFYNCAGDDLLVTPYGDEGGLRLYTNAPCDESADPESFLCDTVHDSWCDSGYYT